VSRAANRAEAERAKARVRGWLARWRFFKGDTPDRVGRRARTPHPCSCLGCGNERRHLGPTLQELRAAASDREAPVDIADAAPDPDDGRWERPPFDDWCDWSEQIEAWPGPLRVGFLDIARLR
jgi:hypothetical protein